ncbi:Selenocysteine lyase/Cysteine desulfurase [Prosthecobacter debontii]|uniref:Selenocysteine lyase/Cysteine desulfurase n=1 Tax=Prosthecobacter debontii TaxID=48467 RepID=A0A1T4Z3D3_9BACT|nr:aminotransferase class V-fold PLP-dependent enzyme [Prosthecobacter debontii]SKB08557.1 Selenocysteine lyase/Cysteine desulfurase [Prosthecobacter debontii]
MLTDLSRSRDFPSLHGLTYLNTAAESIPPLCVGEAIQAYWQDKQKGMRGRDGHFAAVEQCREVSARMLGMATDEVAFCSCSSEAYNLLASALNLAAEDEVVVTDLDFPAGATPWLRAVNAPQVKLWKATGGELQASDLEALLSERTRLVQVSLVSFYNGHRIDWQPLVQRVRERAPRALISVDVTQALGRVELKCPEADIVISSTHKWTLGVHGGCIIGVPRRNAEKLTTHAGGWYHLDNAFDHDRFDRAVPKLGALSFSVGMPNFAALYALNAALRYVDGIGVAAISAHADPLVQRLHAGLIDLGLKPMCPLHAERPTGIVAFMHERSAEIHAALERAEVHVMHSAGRIRLAVHGYNTAEDVERALEVLSSVK